MNLQTINEYRKHYTAKHGIACPLSDAQMVTAIEAAGLGGDDDPNLNNNAATALVEIESSVTSNFPAVDQAQAAHGGTFQAPQDVALYNAASVGFDFNFSEVTADYTLSIIAAE